MKRILVAYDGSPSSAKAFSLGLELCEKYGGELLVLAVARPPEFGTEVETEAVIENSKKHCHDILRPLHAVTAAAKMPTRFEVVIGHPGEQIVRHAEDWKAELITVGHRGRTFFDRLLVGSVAAHVINHATCAVLVAR
jgi:nucleotide-binding universal stress UspA family protein